MANTSYTAAPSLVATNTTNKPTITTDTKLSVTSPWVASGNGGKPDISTSLASVALEGSSTLSLTGADNFPNAYPSVFQSGISYLPPAIGRLAGSVIGGTNVIPFVADNELPIKLPLFVRLGSEILQVTSYGNTTVGSTTYTSLITATNTTTAHPDFTPIHLNSLPTAMQYTSITVPHFYLADVSATGTMSGASNTISSGALPATLGKGQTITTSTGGTTYLPTGTTAVDYSTASGLVTLSNAFNTAAAGITFVNGAAFSASMNPVILTGIASVTSPAGGTNTKMSSLPNIGSVMTGTGMASPTYLTTLDTTNLRIQVSANPTSYGTAVALTSTLTFTCSTTSGSRFLTIKTITVNGVSYPKVGSTNPTWNGRTLASYIKVGAPITTTSGGGIASKWVASIQANAGTVYLSAAATATVATATVTSAITMTANTGRAVNILNNASSEINKLIATGTALADNAGSTAYIPSGATIVKTLAVSSTTTELTMSAASGTTGAWSGRSAQLSTTFTGSSSFSNQITGVTNASTLYQVGSAIYNNQYIPDGTTITGISGTTLTLSNTLTNGFTTYTGQTFKISSSLNIGKTYTSLPVTPLPCSLPVGTTLYLSFGNYIQNLTVTSLGSAGDTTLSVSSFQPRYNFATTSYSYGTAVGLTGGYGYGATITVGLNADLYGGQAILLQANNSTDYTFPITVKSYTRASSRIIETTPFVSPYAYDGQSVGFSTTGTFTGGSDQITSVGSTGGLAVGQQVFSTCLPTMAQCFISAISGSTVTITTPAIADGTGATLSVYSNTFTASIPLTVDTGTRQEIVYPISLPVSSNGFWNINLASPTVYQHNNSASVVYYHWPVPIKIGDVTYRPDFGKFLMWDGFEWRTARVNSVSGVYSILGAVGGGDVTNITLYDPTTKKETAADTYTATPSTGYSTYHGGKRSMDPNGNEWTGATISRIQFHLKVKVPQNKSVGFRSLALQSEYKAAPSVSSIHFTPGDNFEISPFNDSNSVYWYYSDLEKEPQTGWQVNIYDDYTYNRADFDPNDAAIVPFWKASGADDTSEVEITGAHGWVNNERYWAFVRVAKQFHQKQWWGEWNYQRFVVTVDQPAQPIMSILTDNTKSVNKLVIQSTDNLLGFSNGTFVGGLGQWARAVNDTVSSTVSDLNDGIGLGATLATGGVITSLPVGATGFVIVQGALSGTGTGTFKVSASAAGGQDALGFPLAGRFWVTIGTEKILVTNNNDGNKTGDTFTIITRGYKSTTAASHAVGSAVYFGLQNDVYVGSVASVRFVQHTSVTTTTPVTSVVKNYNGSAPYYGPSTKKSLTILGQTQGSHKNSTDRVMVFDDSGLLSHNDVGSTVVLSFRHWHEANKKNVIGRDAQGNKTVKKESVPDKVLTGGDVREVEMKIKSIQDIWSDQAHNAIKINIGATVNQIAGSKAQPTSHITIYPWLPKNQQFQFSNNQACFSQNYLPAGTKLTIYSPSVHDPVLNKDLPAASITVTTRRDWHPFDKTVYINPLTNAPGFQVGNGSCYLIPKNSTISWQPPRFFTSRKVIHFQGSYRDKKGFEAQKLQPGDGLYIIKGTFSPGKPNTATGTHKVTTVVSSTKKVDTNSHQPFVVDFLTQPTVSTGGVLGTLTGSSFTIATGASTQYNAIAFAATPGSVAGAFASSPGIAPNTTVRAVTTVVGGTYAGYYAVTFNNSSGTQTYATVQYANVTANVVSSPVYTSINAAFIPSNTLKIAAGSQSIPVRPVIPNFAYPKYLPISIQYPSFYGENVLAVDPSSGSGGSGDISEISLYPAGWSFTDQNPVRVNAGQTYGLSAFSKLVVGSGTPTFAPHIDWYDEVGSLLKSSYGTESLNNPGTINSVTIGVQMNTSTSLWGQGWHPVAMAAVAPTITLGTATFTSTTTSTGNFVIGSQVGFSSINLKAGASLVGSDGTTYTLTSDVTATSAGFTLPVRFTAGITVPSSTVLIIRTTRAVPVLRWTGVSSADVYGVSGVLLKALEAPSQGSGQTASTELPKLTQQVSVANNQINNAFPVPSTTPIAGLNSIYVFDPVGDYNTREIHYGGSLSTLWTSTTGAVAVGTTNVTLNSVSGLAAGGALIFQYGHPTNEETVYIDSSWAGGAVVPIAAPYFTKGHPKGCRVYSYTAGLASEVAATQAVNTPVAVFNYGPDGYIASNVKTYQYKVEKSEDNGVTWTTLRNGNTLKANDTGVAYITDYEAVPGKTTYYRARATHYVPPSQGDADYTVTGPPSVQLAANVISNESWWLTSTSDSTLRFPILVKTGYSETQRHPSGVFYPLGSSRPITTAGVPTGRDGSITITWTDLANFDNFLALLKKGETLVLTNPVESDRKYIFINQDISITHNAANSPYREISISYVEAAPPAFGYTYGS